MNPIVICCKQKNGRYKPFFNQNISITPIYNYLEVIHSPNVIRSIIFVRNPILWHFLHKFHHVGVRIFNLDSGMFCRVFYYCVFILCISFIILHYVYIICILCTILHFLFLCLLFFLYGSGKMGIGFWKVWGQALGRRCRLWWTYQTRMKDGFLKKNPYYRFSYLSLVTCSLFLSLLW